MTRCRSVPGRPHHLDADAERDDRRHPVRRHLDPRRGLAIRIRCTDTLFPGSESTPTHFEVLPVAQQTRKTNPGNAANAFVRVILADAGTMLGGMSEDEWQKTLDWFGGRCAYTGEELVEGETDRDHAIPMNRAHCGLHLYGNVLPATREANGRKAGKHYREFVEDPERLECIEAFVRESGYWDKASDFGDSQRYCEAQYRAIDSLCRVNRKYLASLLPDADEEDAVADPEIREQSPSTRGGPDTLPITLRDAQLFASPPWLGPNPDPWRSLLAAPSYPLLLGVASGPRLDLYGNLVAHFRSQVHVDFGRPDADDERVPRRLVVSLERMAGLPPSCRGVDGDDAAARQSRCGAPPDVRVERPQVAAPRTNQPRGVAVPPARIPFAFVSRSEIHPLPKVRHGFERSFHVETKTVRLVAVTRAVPAT